MRLVRRKGNFQKSAAVERAHEQLAGAFKTHGRIAAEIYHRLPSDRQVKEEIERIYGVKISRKTASLWINAGQDEVRNLATEAAS